MSDESTRFQPEHRLSNALEYASVFRKPSHRIAKGQFLLLAKENKLNIARLGLAISKQSTRKAVDRNRVKRLVREVFRKESQRVAGLDIIFLVRKGESIDKHSEVQDSINKLWLKFLDSVKR